MAFSSGLSSLHRADFETSVLLHDACPGFYALIWSTLPLADHIYFRCSVRLREFVGEARKAGCDEHPGVLGDRGIYVAVNSFIHIYVSLSQNFCEIVTPLFSQLWRGLVASAFLQLLLFFI